MIMGLFCTSCVGCNEMPRAALLIEYMAPLIQYRARLIEFTALLIECRACLIE